nr:hypothetical protein [Tanacetum cinerariifolium]
MVRVIVQLETAVNTISHEYLLDFTSEYGILEMLHPELPGPGDRIVDFPEGKNNRFFWVDERVFSTVVDWRTNAPKDGMPAAEDVTVLGRAKSQILSGGRDMDLFSLIRAPNPTKVKVGSRPRAPHEVPLLTLTANRVIEMDDPATATDSSGVPSTIERSRWIFLSRPGPRTRELLPQKFCLPRMCRRPLLQNLARELSWGKEPRRHTVGLASTAFMPEDAPTSVSDPDPLFFADPSARPSADVAQSSLGIAVVGDPEFENASSPTEVGSPGGVYRPEWGVTNGSLLDAPEACQDLVDHLRLRFEQEARLLKKFVAQVARRDKRIQARELEVKNLEALLETEADMKKAAEDKSAGLIKELEDMRARFSDLQVSHEHLSQQVASLKEQVSGEEKLKAAFEEFKRYEDDRVERRWVIGHGLRLAAMKCGESLDMRQAFVDVVSAGIAKALQALKDLKYPLLDQLEGLKDAPIDVIMAALYLKSDTREDAPQCIRDLCPSSSQLTIPVYPEVRDPRNPWACKEEIVLADAIAVNISRAEKKKKCRIVCRTHGVGSAHHARSDGVPVSTPTVVPQGLALLLVDAATQTE